MKTKLKLWSDLSENIQFYLFKNMSDLMDGKIIQVHNKYYFLVHIEISIGEQFFIAVRDI